MGVMGCLFFGGGVINNLVDVNIHFTQLAREFYYSTSEILGLFRRYTSEILGLNLIIQNKKAMYSTDNISKYSALYVF